MKVVVDFDLCESNGMCVEADPETFLIDENDFLVVLEEEPPATRRERVEAAVKRCPRQAIRIEET